MHNPAAHDVTVTFETYGTSVGTCGINTVLFLRDADGKVLAMDDDSGVDSCAASYVLPAGATVYAHVLDYDDNDTISQYRLVASGCGNGTLGAHDECEDGNYTDDDGCQDDCTLPCLSGSGAYRAVSLGGTCYASFGTPLAWAAAETACVGLGGHLATIPDAATNAILKSIAPSLRGWIGVSDMTTEGTFVWVSGATDTYRNWTSGEPNDSGGNEDCGEIYNTTGQWNDNTCTSLAPYLCSVVP